MKRLHVGSGGRGQVLARRVLVLIVLFSSAVTLVLTGTQLHDDYRSDVRLIDERMEQIEVSYLESVKAKLWIFDREQLRVLLNGMLNLRDMQYIEVRKDNEILMSVGSPREENIISRDYPILHTYQGREIRLGTLRAVATLDTVYGRLWNRVWSILLGNGVKTFFVSLFILLLFQRLVARHLDKVAQYVHDLDFRQPRAPLGLDRTTKRNRKSDELDHVVTAINDMQANLERSYGALRESEGRFKDYVEAAAETIWEMDEDLRFTFSSKPAAENRTAPPELLGKTRWELAGADPDQDEYWRRHRADLEAHRPFRDFRHGMVHKDGRVHYWRVSGKPVFDAAGAFKGYRGTATDATVEVETQDALRESEERFKAFIENSPTAISIKDTDARYLMTNREHEKILGVTKGQVMGKTPHDIYPADLADSVVAHQREVLESGKAVQRELTYVLGDEARSFLVVRFPVPDAAGDSARVGSISMDITERKRAEEALRESEERFRQIYENTPVMLHSIDKDARLLSVSDYWLETLGYNREEALGRRSYEFYSEKSRRYAKEETIPEFIRTGFAKDLPFQVVKKNGEVMDVLLTAVAVRDDQGTFVRSLAVMTDVTERKRAEERFRSYFDLPLVGSAIYAPDKRWIEVNDKLCELFGYSRDELMALTWVDITHPDDIAENLRLFDRALAGEGDDAYTMDKRFVRKDGKTIHTSVSAQCVRRPDGAPDYFIVLVQDLTERKRAAEALHESEERFEAFVENSPAAISIKDTDARYLLTNPEHKKLFGVTRGQVMGKTPHDIFTAEQADLVMAHQREVLESGKAVERELTYVLGDEARTFLVVKFPVPDAAGDPAGVASMALDITERKRAEMALRESEAKLTDAVEAMGEHFALFDADERLLVCNKKYREVFGELADLFVPGATYEGLLREIVEGGQIPAAVERVEEWVGERLDLFRNPRGPFELELVDGRWLLIREEKTRDGGTVCIRVDITERKKTETQLIRASRLATLGEMASGIAHELNQPLTNMRMMAENALAYIESADVDAAVQTRKLEGVIGQVDRMAGIVDHMRLFSRKDSAERETFSPTACAAAAVGMVENQYRALGVRLERDLPARCRNVSGHRFKLEQVILNLLSNACDATVERAERTAREGSEYVPAVAVRIAEDKTMDTVILSVSDNGGGVPEDVLDEIFDPFFTTKAEGHGTGLGLSISYSIIDTMGGRIEVRNAAGGARFDVILPATDEAHPRLPAPKPQEQPSAAVDRRGRLVRVLVVDDEEPTTRNTAEYLEYAGYAAATAGNGAEALKLFISDPFDVVVTDCRMPVMDGNQLIRRLRALDPNLPIITMTGQGTSDDGQTAPTADDDGAAAGGPSVVLRKPVRLRDLEGHVRKLTRA